MTSPAISVLVVEDENLFRLCLRTTILRDGTLQVAGDASNGMEAVSKAAALNPDVILMDIEMPAMNGIEAVKLIKESGVQSKIIMLTSHDSEEMVHSALSSGASGYCLKDVQFESLCAAIKAVHNGDVWLDSGIADKVLRLCTGPRPPMSKPSEHAVGLSEREHEMLSILTEGASPQTLADKLDLSQNSTRTQIVNILKKAELIQAEIEDSYENQLNSAHEAAPDKYENLGLLGRGGMSVVYKARHKMLDKLVAIKFLKKSDHDSDVMAERFLLEAKIAGRLSHPNIVSIHDYGLTASGDPYLVMDFADGPSLADVLKRVGRLDESEATDIFMQIAVALEHAHQKGVVHRDIKPANIILSCEENQTPIAKLVDFGLAKMIELDPKSVKITQPGLILGSPIYMSPEQCRGLEVDSRSDIYSFGCLMYEVICGHPPFYGENALDTIMKHILEEPKEPDAKLCSPKLRQLLYRCLRKEPEDRISTVHEIAVSLSSKPLTP